MKKLPQTITYYIKYLQYLVKLFVYKIHHGRKPKLSKKTIKHLPKYIFTHANVFSAIAITILVFSLITPPFIKYLKTPKPISLKRAKLSSPYLYAAESKDLKIYIGKQADNTPTVALQSSDANLVSFTLTNTNKNLKKPKKRGNKLVFESVRDNTDLTYETLTNGIKEEIVLNLPSQGNSFTFDMEIHGANPKMMTTEHFQHVFFDKDDKYMFHFLKPFAYDSNGNQTDKVTLQLQKTKQDANFKTIITVDKNWLNDPNTIYPVYIDPTVVHDTTSEFSTGTFNRNTDTGQGSLPSIETTYQELPADEHTVGLWHMNETSENSCTGGEDACDSSGNGNHGTATGTTIVDAKLNKGRSFNGSSDYVTISDTDSLSGGTKDLSVETWFNTSNATTGQLIVDKSVDASSKDYALSIDTTSKIRFGYESSNNNWDTTGSNGLGTTTLTANTWYHAAFTFNSSTKELILYLNGENEGSWILPTDLPNGSSSLSIGQRGGTYQSARFDGSIDEVRISNIARTPEEIKASASRRPYSTYTSPVIDLTDDVLSWNSLSWDEWGVGTGDGETVYDSTSLFSQWNLNETSGITANNDAEGSSCGGTPANCDLTLTGFDSTASQDADPDSSWTANNRRWGAGALQFDGVDSSVSTNSTINFNSDIITLSFWLNWTDFSDNDDLLMELSSNYNSNDATFLLNPNTSSTGKFNVSIQDGVGGGALYRQETFNRPTSGEWHHYAIILDNSTTAGDITVFLDGAEQPTTINVDTKDQSGNFKTDTLYFMARADTSNFGLGTLDAVQIYSRALPHHEIMSLYNASNIELQTRVGADNSPDDGSWDEWSPLTSENSLDGFEGESSNWEYRKAITISHTGTTVTEYQVMIDSLDTAALISNNKLQSDCDDLRFTNFDGDLLNYYIVGKTCNTSDTKVWVQVDSIPSSAGATINMFYGNPTASAYSNQMDTFSYTTEKNVAYILHSVVDDLEIISLANNNSITHNGTTVNLDKYETDTGTGFGGGSISQFAPISAKAPFNADDDSDDTDSIVPISWAGTELYFFSRDAAETVTIWAIAPWSTATVTVYGQGTAATGCTGVTVATTGSTLTCTNVGAGTVRISSDVPILAFTEPSPVDDQTPVYPATSYPRIGTGNTTVIVNGNATLDYSYYYNGSASQQTPANLAANSNAVITGGSSFGVGAMLMQSDDSNQNYGAMQYGDGDGSDGHVYVDITEQGTVFGSANQADYISIASTQAATCSVYEASNGSLVGSGTATSSNSEVYFLGLGTGDTNVYTTAAWYMECDLPVTAYYQDEIAEEENLVHPSMNRQFTYPTPSVGAPGSETTLASHSNSWINISADTTSTIEFANDSTIIKEGTRSAQLKIGRPQIDGNTVALWHLDETNGDNDDDDIFDETSNNNDGEFNGSNIATAVVDGISGKARDFNGTDDYIEVKPSKLGSNLTPPLPVMKELLVKVMEAIETMVFGLTKLTVTFYIRYTT